MAERRAYRCEAKACQPPPIGTAQSAYRVFLLDADSHDYVPKCPLGHGPLVRQANKPRNPKANGRPAAPTQSRA